MEIINDTDKEFTLLSYPILTTLILYYSLSILSYPVLRTTWLPYYHRLSLFFSLFFKQRLIISCLIKPRGYVILLHTLPPPLPPSLAKKNLIHLFRRSNGQLSYPILSYSWTTVLSYSVLFLDKCPILFCLILGQLSYPIIL